MVFREYPWNLKKFQALPLYVGSGTQKNSVIWKYEELCGKYEAPRLYRLWEKKYEKNMEEKWRNIKEICGKYGGICGVLWDLRKFWAAPSVWVLGLGKIPSFPPLSKMPWNLEKFPHMGSGFEKVSEVYPLYRLWDSKEVRVVVYSFLPIWRLWDLEKLRVFPLYIGWTWKNSERSPSKRGASPPGTWKNSEIYSNK